MMGKRPSERMRRRWEDYINAGKVTTGFGGRRNVGSVIDPR